MSIYCRPEAVLTGVPLTGGIPSDGAAAVVVVAADVVAGAGVGVTVPGATVGAEAGAVVAVLSPQAARVANRINTIDKPLTERRKTDFKLIPFLIQPFTSTRGWCTYLNL